MGYIMYVHALSILHVGIWDVNVPRSMYGLRKRTRVRDPRRRRYMRASGVGVGWFVGPTVKKHRQPSKHSKIITHEASE
jgi:hypothetical protein